MSKLDDLKKLERNGIMAGVITVAAGVVGAVAKARSVVKEDMEESMDKAQRIAERRIYDNAHPIVRLFMKKPEE